MVNCGTPVYNSTHIVYVPSADEASGTCCRLNTAHFTAANSYTSTLELQYIPGKNCEIRNCNVHQTLQHMTLLNQKGEIV